MSAFVQQKDIKLKVAVLKNGGSIRRTALVLTLVDQVAKEEQKDNLVWRQVLLQDFGKQLQVQDNFISIHAPKPKG